MRNLKNILTIFANKIDIIDMNNIPYKKTLEMMKLSNETQKKIVNFMTNTICCNIFTFYTKWNIPVL